MTKSPSSLKAARHRLGLSIEAMAQAFCAPGGARSVSAWEFGARNNRPYTAPASIIRLIDLALAYPEVRRELGIDEPAADQ